jgi:hypothetical protein
MCLLEPACGRGRENDEHMELGALVQTRAESAMMNKCHDSFLSKSCSKVGTLSRRSWFKRSI